MREALVVRSEAMKFKSQNADGKGEIAECKLQSAK